MKLRRAIAAALTAGCLLGLGLLGLAHSKAALVEPEPTLLLLDRHGHFLGEVGTGVSDPVGFWPAVDAEGKLPERVVAATLAIEDRRFGEHPGVDPVAVGRALAQNTRSQQRISGASTLAMQVARMQDPGPRTYAKKVVESLTAIALVDRHGDQQVLAQYLRLAPYGNNLHGIAYAARRYFDKPVADLSWAETAFLTALPQSPGRMNPYSTAGRKRGIARARRILDQLHADGAVDALERERADLELDTLIFHHRPERPAATLHSVIALEERLRSPSERHRYALDPRVFTTLDLPLQEQLQEQLRTQIRDWEARGAGNAAMVVVELETGAVRASVGSTHYFDDRFGGSIDFANTPRNPGSTLKPFLYAEALERGLIEPGRVLDDLRRGPDGIGNADGDFLGPMLPRQALANSRNVPAVEILRRIGLDQGYGLYGDLGLHDGHSSGGHYGFSLALGGMPTTLTQLVQASTGLATDGTARSLVWTNRETQQAVGKRFDPDTARRVSGWLSDPMARLPTFPRMGHSELPFPAAVKTGTSADFRDAWAVAWTDRYVVGVWVGHPDWMPMQQLSGYRAGASLIHDALVTLHPKEAAGLADVSRAGPTGEALHAVCPLSGGAATPACTSRVQEWLPRSPQPCAWHVRIELDAEGDSKPRARSAVDLPPRYAAWAERAGLTVLPRKLSADGAPSVAVLSPNDGDHLLRDPEAPEEQGTVLLAAAVSASVEQVVWYVDGEPWKVVEAPYSARWPVQPGRHTLEARLPYASSGSKVTITAH
ncbi:MAG: transglycosylase domain-containing protein [Proteobacteria bacterium]|nr:transglycosylase domain-containing protein [Pseudomonadota bacterium]